MARSSSTRCRKPYGSVMTIAANQPSKDSASRIRRQFLASGDALTALAERSAEVDRLVMDAAQRPLFPGVTGSAAVLAVGGYGRRQLFPYSDIDVLLLFPSERPLVAAKEAISAFLQHLWDAGLRMSHSVRTPDECVEVHDSNTELNISLLDQRFLTGDRTLYAGLADRLPRFIHANRDALVRNLAQLTRDRHTKYAGTFYHLEPNVKDTPGGLRDYQLVCWLGQLRDGAADPTAELREAYRFLARLRCYLHIQTGRDNNLLTFDAQDALAEHWHLPGAAQWMREYYRHSRAIYRAAIRQLEAGEGQASSLFAQLRDFRSRVSNAEFSIHRERVHFRAPQRLDVEPELALRLFEFVARHGVRLSAEAEQRLEARLHRVPGDPRLFPPLYRGRAHPGHAAKPVGPAHRGRALAPQFSRSSRRDQRAGRPRLRAPVSRCRQELAHRGPHRRFARSRRGPHDAHPYARAGSRHGAVPH